MGNHEYFPLVDFGAFEKILSHGEHITDGRKTWIQSQYEKSRELRDLLEYHGHRDWLLSLPHIIERDEFIVVH